MKRTTILNRDLSAALASLGHGDMLIVCDAGFPVPNDARRIDLAVCRDLPRLEPVLEAIHAECVFEKLTVGKEVRKYNPPLFKELGRIFPGLPIKLVVVPDRETHNWSDGETVKLTRDGHPSVQWGVFHVVSQEDGRHFLHVPKPASVDEALQFDPLQYFPDTVEQYRQRFQREHDELQERAGEAGYVIPQHYTTQFHWALAILGFELLCEVGMEEDDFHALMERFSEISRRITTAWSQVRGLKAFICHDDLTMTSGPIFAPDWYRRHVFPFYPATFAPLKAAGVPVIYTSDGNCTCFVDDIFASGADGLNFEYLVDLTSLVKKHNDKILIGNMASEILTSGPVERIERDVRRIVDIGRHAPRFVFNVGGGLTHNMSIPHLEAYLRIRKHLCREAREAQS